MKRREATCCGAWWNWGKFSLTNSEAEAINAEGSTPTFFKSLFFWCRLCHCACLCSLSEGWWGQGRTLLSLENPDADCCNLGNPAGPPIWAAPTLSIFLPASVFLSLLCRSETIACSVLSLMLNLKLHAEPEKPKTNSYCSQKQTKTISNTHIYTHL